MMDWACQLQHIIGLPLTPMDGALAVRHGAFRQAGRRAAHLLLVVERAWLLPFQDEPAGGLFRFTPPPLAPSQLSDHAYYRCRLRITYLVRHYH